LLNIVKQLVFPATFWKNIQLNVWSIKTGNESFMRPTEQLYFDVTARRFVGGGGHSGDRHIGKTLSQLTKGRIFRSKCRTPLGHAMGFINGNERDFQSRQGV